MSGVTFGCHMWGAACYWHLLGGDQGYYLTSRGAQGIPHCKNNDLPPVSAVQK